MKIQHLLFVSPFCASVAFGAPDVRPLPSALEHKTLPSALKRSLVTQPSTIPNSVGEVLPVESTAPGSMADVSEAISTETSVRSAPAQSELALTAPTVKKKPRRLNTVQKTPHPSSKDSSSLPSAQTSSEEARTNEAIKLYEARDYQAAIVLLKQLQPFYTRTQDAGMISLVGFAAMEAGESQLALDSFRQAAEWTDDEAYWLVLVDAHLRLNQVDEAQKILDGLPKSKERDQRIDALLGTRAANAFESEQYPLAEKMLLEAKVPLGAGNLELLGWIKLRLDKLAEAAASFEASYRKKPSSGAAQGLAFSHQRLKSIDKLVTLADELKGSLQDLTSDPAVRELLAAGQFSRIAVNEKGFLIVGGGDASTSPSQGVTLTAAPIYRKRNGDAGQGRLDVAGATAQAEWVGERDKVSVKVDQFYADNGALRQKGMNTISAQWKHQTEGVLDLSMGLGLSPTGGELSAKPLGELGVAKYDAAYGWNAKLFRQATMESILSMSGSLQVNAAGDSLRWGQVLEDGITVGEYITLPGALKDWKAEGSFTAARITGTNVADNSKLAFWGRALRPVEGWDGWRVGADMYASAFDKNLTYYTPGFGGYYSPQTSLSAGPAAAFEQQIGPIKVNAYAGLGWGYVQQAAADGNPLTGANPGFYPASSSSGLATHFDVNTEWAIDHNWTLGLNLAGQNSPDYEEWRAWLYLSRKFMWPDAP